MPQGARDGEQGMNEKQTRGRAKVRIQDVARLAEVSLSTVSGVLNKKTNVRPETQRRVLAVIDQLGYKPNIFASNLARRNTKLIGIIVSDLLNPFFAETAKTLDTEARRQGYETFLTSTDFSPEKQRSAVREMLAMRVAGMAMMTSEDDPEAYSLLKSSGTPAVYLDHRHDSPYGGTVSVDKRSGMFVAVEHLLQLGHRRILLVRNSVGAASQPLLSHVERQLGFDDAVHRYQLKEMDVHVIDEPGPSAAAGLKAIAKALTLYEFTAVVAINDLVALGVFHGLQAASLRIPEDVSVVGFDNTYLCRFLHPPLTTVATPREELAKGVVDMLVASIDEREHDEECSLTAELVIRASTSRPATLPKER